MKRGLLATKGKEAAAGLQNPERFLAYRALSLKCPSLRMQSCRRLELLFRRASAGPRLRLRLPTQARHKTIATFYIRRARQYSQLFPGYPVLCTPAFASLARVIIGLGAQPRAGSAGRVRGRKVRRVRWVLVLVEGCVIAFEEGGEGLAVEDMRYDWVCGQGGYCSFARRYGYVCVNSFSLGIVMDCG